MPIHDPSGRCRGADSVARPHRWALAALFGLGVVAALLVGGTAAQADGHCPPAGGDDPPFVPSEALIEDDHALRVLGGGWGHGVGMSQYGARGAARLGCTYEQILTTYYTGTAVEAPDPPGTVVAETVRVGFHQGVTEAHVRHDGEGADEPVAWVVCEDATTCETPGDLPPQEAGEVRRVTPTGGGGYRVEDGDAVRDGDGDDDAALIWEGGADALLRIHHEDTVIAVSAAHPDDAGTVRGVRWGFHQLTAELVEDDETDDEPTPVLYAVQHVTEGDGHPGMERYLWGIDEVPSSWHDEVLKSQALAARSFAAQRIGLTSREQLCRCDLRATVADQHYTGWAKESETVGGEAVGLEWKAAVNATAGEVVTYADEDGERRIADTFYSSSVGGWTENSEDVFVAPLPYLRAIDTSRWEGEGESPHQRWERGFSAEELEDVFDLDEFVSFTVVDRGDGGRPVNERHEGGDVVREAGVEVRGIRDGQPVADRYSGEQLRWTLGLRSGLVYVPAEEPTSADRRAGVDRVGTAVSVARYGWSSADSVVLARADDPADALAGASLAGQLDAPLLITPRDHLADEVAEVIDDLGAEHAVLLGGENALSAEVEEELLERGVVPDRVAGRDRNETAAEIADRLVPPPGDTALLVFSSPHEPSLGWPDALSVSGLAARRAADGDPWPIFLTAQDLPAATLAALDDHDIDVVRLVGGTAVISEEVAAELTARGYATARHAGTDRFATSRAVVAVDGAAGPVVTATGRDFPDGLAAGPLAGRIDASVLLVPQGSLDDATGHRKWVRDRIDRQPDLVVVGGSGAVSATVEDQLRDELRVR